MNQLPIKVKPVANTQQDDKGNRIVHQGGESPSFGPTRQPK